MYPPGMMCKSEVVEKEVERLLYRYARVAEGSIRWEPIRELSLFEWEEVSDALNLINSAMSGPPLYSAFAQGDIDTFVRHLEHRLTRRNEIRKPEEWLPEFRYRFIAASAAVRMHQEAVLAEANRRGLSETAIDDLRAVFSSSYDRSLSYRVIYALRNLLVHGSDRVLRTQATATLQSNETTTARVDLRLSRADFASSSANAAVRRQVAALLEDPDLLAMAAEASSVVLDMRRDLDPILYPGQELAVELIHRYIEEVHELGGGGPHFHMQEAGNPFVVRAMLPMTEKVFNFVLQAHRPDLGAGKPVAG